MPKESLNLQALPYSITISNFKSKSLVRVVKNSALIPLRTILFHLPNKYFTITTAIFGEDENFIILFISYIHNYEKLKDETGKIVIKP